MFSVKQVTSHRFHLEVKLQETQDELVGRVA